MGWELILGPIFKIIDKIVPDAAERDRQKLEIMRMAQAGEFKEIDADLALMTGQLQVNEAEAATPGLFKGGWRPFIGWVCGIALAYNYLAREVLMWASVNAGWLTPPALNLDQLMPILLGMLGLAGYRTFERIKGKA
jgi:hypothetical protein